MLQPNRLLVSLIVIVAAVGCSKGSGKKGSVVAKGDGIVVTADEFKAKLDEQSPFIRSRYSTLDRKKEFLENLIRFELLAHEAEVQKLDQDPEVKETLRKLLVQRLVRKAMESKDGAAQVSDSNLKNYYQQHLEEFQKPERLRLSQIFLKAEKGSPDRVKKAAEAKKLYAQLKTDEAKNPLAFANTARDFSEDAGSKAAGGDLGYRTKEELEKQFSKEVAEAAFLLKDPGQETGIVESSQGFHVMKLGVRQPAVNRSLDEVKAQLTSRLGRETKAKEFDDYVKGLREKAGIKIDDGELEKIAVAAAPAPASQPVPHTSAAPVQPGGAVPASR
jgi:peptidyl-prolyl cis-trans isomerase C